MSAVVTFQLFYRLTFFLALFTVQIHFLTASYGCYNPFLAEKSKSSNRLIKFTQTHSAQGKTET